MTDERALLLAMAANPEDDTVRLAYADFVEEVGDPDRAAFIRNQVAMARFAPSDPARRPYVLRNREFMRTHIPAWRAALPQLAGIEWGDFNRGLVEEVQAVSETAILRHSAAIFAEPAIHVIRLASLFDARRLAELPELARIRAVRMVSAHAASEAIQSLLASPYLENVQVLDLHGNASQDAGAIALAQAKLPALVELWLGANGIRDAGGRALAESAELNALRWLDLRGNAIADGRVRGALSRRFGAKVKM